MKLYGDPWIPRPTTFGPITPSNVVSKNWYTLDLILYEPRRWNEDLVRHIFWGVDYCAILSIPLGLAGGKDCLNWLHDQDGEYSARSRYRALMEEKKLESSFDNCVNVKWWKSYWRLKIPTKIKIFLWRFFHNILPFRATLAGRGIKCAQNYIRCGDMYDLIMHALIFCEYAC